jgi:hypothetical protein
MSELTKQDINIIAKKLYKSTKLVSDTTILFEEITNEFLREDYDDETMKKIALKYKSITDKAGIEYMFNNMNDSYYQNMDDLMNRIEELLDSES